MINIGIIGCGRIAQVRHIPEYAANPDCELKGFYDLDKTRAEEMAAKYGGRVYDTAQDLIADPAIDAVSVCTANASHAEMTVNALKAGKHVLCEKPMAATIEECEEMVKTAKDCKKFLMIGQNQRLAASHVHAKKLIREGKVGRVLTFRTAFGHSGPENWSITPGNNTWFFDKSKAVMGAMADLGIHKTDLIQFLLGENVVKTTAKVFTTDKKGPDGAPIGVDDNAVCIFEMEGGAVGTMTASWTYYGAEDNSTVIYGSEGEIRIYDDPDHTLVLKRRGEAPVYFDEEGIQTNENQTKSGVIDLWIESLKENKEPALSGESVLSAMRAVFASLKSAAIGKTVEIPENRRKEKQ
ncbi:MAG: Gfo/Idh/MocA family oxidoreductase [Eubacterium sp.]|nr:Gfo/Idh/MocA family oxidoreductase [Eubacterium sp.]